MAKVETRSVGRRHVTPSSTIGLGRMPGGTATITADEIESGLPVTKVFEVSQMTGLTETQVRTLSRISASTFARRQKKGKLSAEESDRLARLSRITTAAFVFFQGDRDDARRWLNTPAPALDDKKPIEVMVNDAGVKAVEDLLVRLEHGVFT